MATDLWDSNAVSGYTPEANEPTPLNLLENVFDLPFEEYRKIDALNFHSLKDFQWDPKAWHGGYFETKQRTSPALTLGTQLHELVLQGAETFHENNALWTPPLNPSTGKPFGPTSDKYKNALSDFGKANAGKNLYTDEDWITLGAMREAIQWHPVAGPMLYSPNKKRSELVVHGEIIPGFKVKGAIDRYDEQYGIIDLKTTASLEDESGRPTFRYNMRDYGYVEQLAYYQMLIHEVCGGNIPPVAIVAVETQLPFRVGVFVFDAAVMEKARTVINEWLKRFITCRRLDKFPSKWDSAQPVTAYWNAELKD